ncbi:SIR2 family protein [Planctomycetota bacterium]|nr:SIR2 family protein [Planctomycetota bacterium]
MSEELKRDLEQQVQEGSAFILVGAGVSIAASGNADTASWTGLLKDGVSRVEQTQATRVHSGWVDIVTSEIESGDLDDLLSAAEKISRKLGAPDKGEFRKWLRESIGDLKIRDPSLLEAIRDLDLPIATTNYDGFLEEVTGYPAVTWQDWPRVQRVLRRDEQGIIHLHGHWDTPESVILGLRSYERILANESAQAFQQLLRATHSLLFLGYGGGLADPNFSALMRWARGVFQGKEEYRNFRLERSDGVEQAQRQHEEDDRVFVLPYGTSFEDFPDYLRGLVPKPTASPSGAAPPLEGLKWPEGLDDEDEVELGWLDHSAVLQESQEGIASVLAVLTSAIEVVGSKVAGRAEAANDLDKNNARALKKWSNAVAGDLDQFALQLRPSTQLLMDHFKDLSQSLISIAALAADSGESVEAAEIESAITQFDKFRESISAPEGNLRSLRDSVQTGVPATLTGKLKKAKRRAVLSLDELLAAFERATDQVSSAQASLRSLLG